MPNHSRTCKGSTRTRRPSFNSSRLPPPACTARRAPGSRHLSVPPPPAAAAAAAVLVWLLHVQRTHPCMIDPSIHPSICRVLRIAAICGTSHACHTHHRQHVRRQVCRMHIAARLVHGVGYRRSTGRRWPCGLCRSIESARTYAACTRHTGRPRGVPYATYAGVYMASGGLRGPSNGRPPSPSGSS